MVRAHGALEALEYCNVMKAAVAPKLYYESVIHWMIFLVDMELLGLLTRRRP